jgi:transcriptional regulator with XRE-family HTH domain
MNVSPQYISKLLSGQENLTLETLMKLQTILDIPLLATSREAHINALNSKIAKLEKKVVRLNEKLKDQTSLLPIKPAKKASTKKSGSR